MFDQYEGAALDVAAESPNTKYLVFQKWKRHTDFINNMNKQREDKAIARMALVTAAYSKG